MTSQLFSFMSRFETEVITRLRKDIGRAASSLDIYRKVIDIINEAAGKGKITYDLASFIRLAIKLNPYAPEVQTLLLMQRNTLKALVEQQMPAILEVARACGDKGIPVPLIISCEKYKDAATALQQSFRERYFSIPPIIVRGDPSLNEPRLEFPVFSFPVADTYEALPIKVFEAFTFLQALDERCGVLKIDDDLTLTPDFALELKKTAALFASADYMGIPVHTLFHDRVWHFGKCTVPTPAVYGKPMKTAWARGALYFLSPHALERLSQYYLRFPGCLEGECYEDKAVGDVLHDNGILMAQCVLEGSLGLDSKAQDRH